jgi:hypothetical protein
LVRPSSYPRLVPLASANEPRGAVEGRMHPRGQGDGGSSGPWTERLWPRMAEQERSPDRHRLRRRRGTKKGSSLDRSSSSRSGTYRCVVKRSAPTCAADPSPSPGGWGPRRAVRPLPAGISAQSAHHPHATARRAQCRRLGLRVLRADRRRYGGLDGESVGCSQQRWLISYRGSFKRG